MASPNHTRRDSMDALHATSSANIRSIIAEVQHLRTSMTQEICTLRHDVDTLQRGGWTVTVGAFQKIGDPDRTSIEAIEQRILGKGIEGLQSCPHSLDDSQISPENQADDNYATTNGTATGQDLEVEKGVKGSSGFTSVKEKVKIAPRKKSPLPSKFPSPDEAVPSIEDPALATRSAYAPLVIRQLSPLMPEIATGIPNPAATRTFSVKFIHSLLEGCQWSPGYYFIPRGPCALSTRAYYGLDASTDPFLPPAPGTHGAKLVPFIRCSAEEDDPDDQNTLNVPVFIKASTFATLAGKPSNEYVYFGNYSQLRFSDRLDYDRMIETVPNSVKMHWAELVADVGRPTWVTEALMNHLEKQPEFDGDVDGHAEELKRWEKEIGQKVDGLTREDILKAFESADCADPPGLRLWWEYLQCVGYDEGLYKALVKKQEAFKQKH